MESQKVKVMFYIAAEKKESVLLPWMGRIKKQLLQAV